MVLPYENEDYGEVGAKNMSELEDVTLASVTTGDIIKYDGSKFINFAPTYLDGSGIIDNYLIKLVSGVTTTTTFIETSILDVGTSLKTYIPTTGGLAILGGSIETEFFDTTKRRMHLTGGEMSATSGITITSDGRVGIGVIAPAHSLDVSGNVRFFNDLTTDGILGTVSNVGIRLDQTRVGLGRIYFNTGVAGMNIEFLSNELNAFYNGSATGLYLNYNGGSVFYGSPGTQLSDDRIKFNETNITNGLEVVRKLSPERYTKRLPTQTVGAVEAGFIAQEVLSIPDLEFAVKQSNKEIIAGDPNTNYYTVTYDSIFTYAVAGLKELDAIVQQQQTVIQNLVTRIEALESK
jgi:hypothetical protein